MVAKNIVLERRIRVGLEVKAHMSLEVRPIGGLHDFTKRYSAVMYGR